MKLPAIKLPNLGPRERLFAFGGAMALALLVLDRLVLGPWMLHMRHVQTDISRLEKAIDTERRLLSRRDAVMLEVSAYQDLLRLAGPKENELAQLLREIETLGGDSGINLGDVKPIATDDQGLYQVRAFEVQCEGTLPDIVRFLYLLQTSKSLYLVDQAMLELKDQGTSRLKGVVRVSSLAIEAPPALAPMLAPKTPAPDPAQSEGKGGEPG